jgi:hypothetical protein
MIRNLGATAEGYFVTAAAPLMLVVDSEKFSSRSHFVAAVRTGSRAAMTTQFKVRPVPLCMVSHLQHSLAFGRSALF